LNKACLGGIILLVALAAAVPCCGQETHLGFAAEDTQFRREENGVWEIEKIQVGDAAYEHMLPASCGRVAVFADERWGFVDLDGELVVPMQFYSVNSYIDEMGKIAIPLQYEEATDMRNNMAAVRKDGLWGFIDKDGGQIQPHIYDHVLSRGDGSYIVYKDTQIAFISDIGEFLPVETEALPPENPNQKK
jgi:hypothetical protein